MTGYSWLQLEKGPDSLIHFVCSLCFLLLWFIPGKPAPDDPWAMARSGWRLGTSFVKEFLDILDANKGSFRYVEMWEIYGNPSPKYYMRSDASGKFLDSLLFYFWCIYVDLFRKARGHDVPCSYRTDDALFGPLFITVPTLSLTLAKFVFRVFFLGFSFKVMAFCPINPLWICMTGGVSVVPRSEYSAEISLWPWV